MQASPNVQPVSTGSGWESAGVWVPERLRFLVSQPRWLLVWAVDPLGECCCERGSVRGAGRGDGAATGARGGCPSPGKHPWSPGFPGGVGDAMPLDALCGRWPGWGGWPQVRLAVTLADVLVVDLDGQRSVRDFARLAGTVRPESLLAVAATPRGWHVWLKGAGWSGRGVNMAMSHWLSAADWSRQAGEGWASSEGKVGFRGFVVDVRTGARRYVLWPDEPGVGARRWVEVREFADVLEGLRRQIPRWRQVASLDGRLAPWNIELTDDEIAAMADAREVDVSRVEHVRGRETVVDIEERLAQISRARFPGRADAVYHGGVSLLLDVLWGKVAMPLEQMKGLLGEAGRRAEANDLGTPGAGRINVDHQVRSALRDAVAIYVTERASLGELGDALAASREETA